MRSNAFFACCLVLFSVSSARSFSDSASSMCTNTSIMWVFVISCAVIMPVDASCAHCLSIFSFPGMPSAITMSQFSSSISFLHATGRSFMPGTVCLLIAHAAFFLISSIAISPMLSIAKVVSAIPILIVCHLQFVVVFQVEGFS